MVCMGLLCGKQVVYAGGINGNEASVIAAASGTFEYNGKTYRAASNYLNALTIYLSEDDVDLDASQASEAISRLYGSIAQGVDAGYLYEVDPNEETTTEEPDKPAKPVKPVGEEEEDPDKTTEDSSQTVQDATTEATTESIQESAAGLAQDFDIWEPLNNKTEAKETLEQRPEVEDASVLVEFDEDDIVIRSKDETKDSIVISKKKPMISDTYVHIMDGVGITLLILTAICMVLLIAKKCMVFRKDRRRKARPGHSKRRILRHRTRAVLTATTAVGLVGIFLLMGVYVGLFNKDAIMQNMQSSGYFRYAYSQYLANIANDVQDQLIDNDEAEILSYEEYLFVIKQNTMKILSGEEEIPIPDSNVAPYITNIRKSYLSFAKVGGVCMALTVLLGVIFMIYMDMSRERGVKHVAASVLIASGVMMILTALTIVMKPYEYLYIEPDYLYLFFVECMKRCSMVMSSITAFGVVLGMILVGVFYTIRNKKED